MWKSWYNSLVSDTCYRCCHCTESWCKSHGFVELTYQWLHRVVALQWFWKDISTQLQHCPSFFIPLSHDCSTSTAFAVRLFPPLLWANTGFSFAFLLFLSLGCPKVSCPGGLLGFLVEIYLAYQGHMSLQNCKAYFLNVCWCLLPFLSFCRKSFIQVK